MEAPKEKKHKWRREDYQEKTRGLLMVHTGNGKVKTTCALGLMMRAAGRGLNCCMIQFMKSRNDRYGEHVSADTWHVVQHEGFHQFARAVIGGPVDERPGRTRAAMVDDPSRGGMPAAEGVVVFSGVACGRAGRSDGTPEGAWKVSRCFMEEGAGIGATYGRKR